MHTEDESGGFWPGYVAAVASLVLSLLLIAAVLALTLYQVGMLAGKKVHEAAAAVVAPAVVPAVAPRSGETDLVLEFSEQGWRLDAQAQSLLLEQIRQQVQRGIRNWQLSVQTDTEDPLLLRGAYLRLLAARNVFLQAGVQGDRVQVRLLHAPQAQRIGRELRIRAGMGPVTDGGQP